MMTPTHSALPDIRQWRQRDARLMWSFDLQKREYIVKGFGKKLKCVGLMEDEEEKKKNEEKERQKRKEKRGVFSKITKALFGKKFKGSPSGADPSNILGEDIVDEEDILHIRKLPTFNGRLTQRDSELFLSYLTVPYLRIPLILNFFAHPARVKALAEPQLQNVLDSVLYEPDLWQELDEKKIPEKIPTYLENREFLATPNGLLFNELKHSPQGLMKSLSDLLELVLEMV
eukprot:391444-Amorphochlora_amoeboformis.AAC.1